MRVQSDGVPVLRALFVLALMLNGTVLPHASAMDDAPDAATEAGHHGMEHSSEQAPADKPIGDCCDGMGCGCGCAGPQTVPLPVAGTLRAWDRAPAAFTCKVAPFSSSPVTAPFRPPA